MKESTPNSMKHAKLQPLKKYESYPVNNNIFSSSQKNYEYGEEEPKQVSPKIGVERPAPGISYKQMLPTRAAYKDALARRKDA
jgi:hypothetical protein